jgi:hypothetical protein
MNLLDRALNIFGLAKSGGGGQLPPVEEPKVKPKQVSFPGYVTTTRTNDAVIQKLDPQVANLDITANYRTARSTAEVVRNLARTTPDLATALSAYLRVGIPEKFIVLARNPDGSINDDGTRVAFELLQRMDRMPDYASGFSQVGSIRSVSEGLAKDALIEGAMALELVLDKARLPYKFQPVAVKGVKFYPDESGGTRGLKPVQDVGGEEIDLDIATFFMAWIDPSLTDPYPQGPFESAVQPVLASAQFMTDMRRVLQRHIYPRYNITIDEEILRKNTPQEILMDETKLNAYINERVSQVVTAVQDLNPEDAIVHFDFVTVEFIKYDDGQGTAEKFKVLEDIINRNLAKGVKTLPAILGNGAGTQNVASTETMLFLMSANSMIRLKLQELYSKAMTLAVRLFGLDVTVDFEFDDIELRPETELEAFKTQRLDRWMRLWGLGIMSDMEFCMRVNYMPMPPNFVSQSGTLTLKDILSVKAAVEPGDNAYSGTGAGGGQSGGGAANQSRKSGAQEKPRGGK